MSMTRRTKRDMELMKDDCTYYLLQTNNNYHKAYDLFVKDYLTRGESLPYHIKGMKDFLQVSQLLAIEWNRVEQMDKKNRERATKDNEIKDYIMSMSKDEIRNIYKAYKDDVRQSDKLVLHDVYIMIMSDCMDDNSISQGYINLFRNIYNDRIKLAV